MLNINSLIQAFFSVCVFSLSLNIHESQDSRGKEKSILTPYYQFYSLHKHLDANRKITAESSPLEIGNDWTQIENPYISSASRSPLSYTPQTILRWSCVCI